MQPKRSTARMEYDSNSLRDSERREREESRRNAGLVEALASVQSIVDTIREPLLVLDESLRVVTASRAFYRVFLVSPAETEGRLVYELGNGQWDIPALRVALEEVLPKEKSFRDFEVVHEFPSLGRRAMLLNGQKLWREGHHPERVLLAIEDVTERKRLQDELLRSNEDLQRFAYVAAHDLRSPLNSALGIFQLFAQRMQGRLDATESEMLRLARESMQRLSALMQDILTYSELEGEHRQKAPIALEEPVRIALANLQSAIEVNRAEIAVSDLPTVTCDRTQLTLLMQNLISNAIKYRGTEAPRIRIEAMRDGDFWRVSVSDNGQGFDAHYAARIFEPFQRLHGWNIPGSGIGLATCKRIVEQLGGQIGATSAPGVGSTFFFTIPA